MRASVKRQQAVENRLLAALPPEECERLLPALEMVRLDLGDVLYEPEQNIPFIYFPTGCVIATTVSMKSGASAEVGMVGREGMICLTTFLECDTTPFRAVVQNPGEALRMKPEDFKAEVRRSARLTSVLHRYADAFLTQVSYSAACNSLHTLEQRCCRWLLMTQDRAEPNHFTLTQEFLAQMLGVQRTSVTAVARSLQTAGLIRYTRGKVTVLDRKRLEAAGCECYGRIKAQFDALPGPAPAPNKNDLEFGRLLEKLPAAAYACDGNGHITSFNRRAAELWGREPKLSDPVDRY